MSDRELFQGIPNTNLFLKQKEQTTLSFHLQQNYYLEIEINWSYKGYR